MCLFANQCESGVYSHQFYWLQSMYLQPNFEVWAVKGSLSAGLIPTVLHDFRTANLSSLIFVIFLENVEMASGEG